MQAPKPKSEIPPTQKTVNAYAAGGKLTGKDPEQVQDMVAAMQRRMNSKAYGQS